MFVLQATINRVGIGVICIQLLKSKSYFVEFVVAKCIYCTHLIKIEWSVLHESIKLNIDAAIKNQND